MSPVGSLLVGFVALQHIAFMILESFLWTSPVGRKIFRNSVEKAQIMAPLAANQGLYNGFLAAGLIWSLVAPDPNISIQLKIFSLSCVVVAGIVGGLTVNMRILVIQSIPAGLALAIVLGTRG